MNDRYFGSVRFFKHLILGTVLLLLLTLATVSVVLGVRVLNLQIMVEALSLTQDEPDLPVPLADIPEAKAGPEVKPQAEHPDYEDLYPDLYAEDTVYDSVNVEKTAYLTFDDGPSTMTPEVLDMLADYGVKATFFTTGRQDSEANRTLMRRIVDEGHTIAIHSYSHDYRQVYESVEAFLADFKAQYDLIYEATGVRPQIFRFPGGSINSFNKRIYQEIIAEMTRRGFTYFDWNVSLEDASSAATVQSMERGLAGLGGLRRAFILIHDNPDNSKLNTVLPYVIERCQALGFAIDRLTPEVTPVQFPYPGPEQG